jgi:hypothetical protein
MARQRRQGQGNRTAPINIAAAKKQAQALELRAYGASYQYIADTVGYESRAGAWKAVDRALQDLIEEPARKVKQIELDRLDRMLIGLFPRAVAGHVGAVDRVLHIMDRRAKYLGLDAPLVIDWQREAANAGFDPAATFEELVQFFTDRLADAAGNGGSEGSGEADG